VITRPPYALSPVGFRFRALASLAGHAALGGARELLLATLLAARLVEGAVGSYPVAPALRRARAVAARAWLSSLAIPAQTRVTFARLFDLTAQEDRTLLADAWEHLVILVTPALDLAARTELRRLGAALAQSNSA
jgi:hypothetical protein